jgi:hypothetical protein
MKVKDLPKVIKKRAMVYIKKEFPIKKYRPKNIIMAFDWSNTTEGYEYWTLVYDGKFIEAENLLLERLKEENPILYKLNQLNEDACINGLSSKALNSNPFFLDEVLDVKVNEPEVVPYKDEYVKIDPVVNSVIDKFLHRSRVGIEKYGTTLAENNTDDFYNHLQEELMDAILYLQKIKELKNK